MVAATKLKELARFSACDVSDALLKLKVPQAGFLPDFRHFAPTGVTSDKISMLPKVAAPASTVLFVPKDANPTDHSQAFHGISTSNIPAGTHWVDNAKKDSFMVISQPPNQFCAALGGIMASRIKKAGAKGIVVSGRVRDLAELKSKHIPIWALGTSTVGTGAQSKPWALEVPITVQGVQIRPGDIVFSDPVEGVVVIPQDKLDAVMEMMPKLVEADDRVKEEVEAGMSVKDAFAKHRDQPSTTQKL